MTILFLYRLAGTCPSELIFFIVYIQDTCLQFHNHKQEVMFVTSGFIVCGELAVGSHINDE